MAGMTDHRGQMLLIGGVLLAVAIIALAVVFNSAVFTSVLAGESYEDISSREPLGFQQEVRDIVGSVIERAVEEENSLADQETYVKNNLTALEQNLQRYQADSDVIVHTSIPPSSNISGDYIYNSTGNFVNESGDNTWDVGTGVRVRNFSLAVTGTSGSEPFTINVSGDSGDKSQIVVKSSEITVDGEDCSWSGSGYLNVTESTIEGDRCNALDFFERLDEPYDIEFHNSKNASGRYSLLVTDAADDVATHDQTPRLFGVNVDLEYFGPKIDWETTVRVAPGEPT